MRKAFVWRWLAVFVAMIAAPLSASRAQERDPRADQWLYVPHGTDDGRALALFMAGSFLQVIFRAECEKKTLVVRHNGDFLKEYEKDPVVLHIDGKPWKMETTLIPEFSLPAMLDGRLTITPEFARAVEAAKDIDITPPDSAEAYPWFTGAALPLKRIVRECH